MVSKLPSDILEFTFLASPYTRIQTCPVSHLLLLITVIFFSHKNKSSQKGGQFRTVIKSSNLRVVHCKGTHPFCDSYSWELYRKTISR